MLAGWLRASALVVMGLCGALAQAADKQPTVIVVGGGMSGASVAKYLRLWSGGRLSVRWNVASAAYASVSYVLNGERTVLALRADNGRPIWNESLVGARADG